MSGVAGRFLGRDPIGHQDGNNHYPAYFAMKGFDPTGMTKVTSVDGSLGGKNGDVGCGIQGSRQWQFELESDAPCSGYFVQHVVQFCLVRDCEACNCAPLSKSRISIVDYWEAWSVTKGSRVKDAIPRSSDRWADQAATGPIDDTCGLKIQIGEVRFYCKNPIEAANGVGTGDLSNIWEYDKTYGVETPCEVTARRLYSADLEPSFWGNGPVEMGNRLAQLSWKCCRVADDNFACFGANP